MGLHSSGSLCAALNIAELHHQPSSACPPLPLYPQGPLPQETECLPGSGTAGRSIPHAGCTSWVKYMMASAQHLAGLLWHREGAEAAREPGWEAGASDLGQALLPMLLENSPGQSLWGWWPSVRAGHEGHQSWLPTQHIACVWLRAMTTMQGPSGTHWRSPKETCSLEPLAGAGSVQVAVWH